MFSIRKPTESIVIDLLADGPKRDHELFRQLNLRIEANLNVPTEIARHFLAWLLTHDQESFENMMADLEVRGVVERHDNLIRVESDWEDERTYIGSRMYELRDGIYSQAVDVLPFLKTA